MTLSKIRFSVIAERVSWVRQMIASIKTLPMQTYRQFADDPRNVASAESYLRRGLEALMDLGRHVLAKGFGVAVTEYKEIGDKLTENMVISVEDAKLFRQMAGYRNRMVHFYHEVKQEELYCICTHNLKDIEKLLSVIVKWLRDHPEKMDHRI
jgi:uncharacterized protein YutE (UPF0331/DUF86 family)